MKERREHRDQADAIDGQSLFHANVDVFAATDSCLHDIDSHAEVERRRLTNTRIEEKRRSLREARERPCRQNRGRQRVCRNDH
jgi:hypothetical protein